jgi:hypothetical protein
MAGGTVTVTQWKTSSANGDFSCPAPPRLNAIDSGFHVVPSRLGHADSGADGDSVTNVRFPNDWDTKIAAIKLHGRALNNVPRVNSQVAGWRTGNRLEPETPAH